MSRPLGGALTYTAVATTTGKPGDTFAYHWVFDDGATSSAASVAHTWTTPGSHTATVTATDRQLLNQATASKTIVFDSYLWQTLSASSFYIHSPISGNLNATTLISAGGLTPSSVLHANTYLYDGTTWTQVGSMAHPRSCFNMNQPLSVIALPSGKAMVCGNTQVATGQNSTELYDPVAGTWSASGNMANNRAFFCYPVLLHDGRVMVWGGTDASATPNNVYEFYDPTAGTWSGSSTHLTTGDTYMCRPLLMADGRVAFFLPASAKLSIYDPVHDTWVNAPPIGSWVAFINDATFAQGSDGNLYLFGLIYSDQTLTYRYNVVANTWTAMPVASDNLNGRKAFSINDGKYIMLANYVKTAYPVHEGSIIFDVLAGAWLSGVYDYVDGVHMSSEDRDYGYGILNNRLVQFGAPNPTTPPYTNVEHFLGS